MFKYEDGKRNVRYQYNSESKIQIVEVDGEIIANVFMGVWGEIG